MILPIKHRVDWVLICHPNQEQINKDNIRKNDKIVDHDYKVGDKVMPKNHFAYKYKTPYKFPFVITHFWDNVTIILQCGAIKN